MNVGLGYLGFTKIIQLVEVEHMFRVSIESSFAGEFSMWMLLCNLIVCLAESSLFEKIVSFNNCIRLKLVFGVIKQD